MVHLHHPSPHFNDVKVARFLLLRGFIIALGDGGSLFYSTLSKIVASVTDDASITPRQIDLF